MKIKSSNNEMLLSSHFALQLGELQLGDPIPKSPHLAKTKIIPKLTYIIKD